ncbi:uncharacterized protein BJ212DRAFT_1297411 [Suillus subaureus]|uniref:Uncharacterized protein n=1 Tax=Suillus subaureus TaxID=48587 RepID=A0A9P7JGG0_9AGAM|nr:uncharacterized protein BJ212DRAFT_1297411 [Suillus subaureus]KAG1820933.1 hypothetical protein BJ212DRAFT_1297411 [Suillus subaureus]
MFISTGSQADIWWNTLTAAQLTSWTTIKVAFQAQWPAIVVAAKSTLDYQEELLMLRLKEDDVGEHITVAGVSTWSHLHYHRHLQKLVQDMGIANAPVFIHQVCEVLPCVIRDLTSPAPATWTVFLDDIKDANIDVIQDKARQEKEKKEAEKVQNLRIAKLENRQMDPIEILRLQMQHTVIGPINTSSPPSSNMNTALNQSAMQHPRGQPPTQKNKTQCELMLMS